MEIKFAIGDRIKHKKYGYGVILGNCHARGQQYYWNIKYDDGTYGYNSEDCLTLVRRSHNHIKEQLFNEKTIEYLANQLVLEDCEMCWRHCSGVKVCVAEVIDVAKTESMRELLKGNEVFNND